MTTTNIERRLPVRTGAEQDVISKHRHVHCYTQRAGVTSKIKRQIRRHERRVAKLTVKEY